MSVNNNERYSVIIINSDVNTEPRVLKQIDALKVVGLKPIIVSFTKSFENAVLINMPRLHRNQDTHLHYPVLIRKSFSVLYRIKARSIDFFNILFYLDNKFEASRIFDSLKPYRENISIVIVHHMKNLPTASILAEKLNARLIFNAHEFYPEQFSESVGWNNERKYLNKIGKDFLKSIDKMFTVCPGIQERYYKDFSLHQQLQVSIKNCAKFYELPQSMVGDKIKLIHHGIANRNRRLELMLEVAELVTFGFEFYFMLVPSPYDPDYFDYLVTEIKKRKNCYLVEPVSTSTIVEHINQYDLGFYMYNNEDNFNMQHYLPNKFFEFIQARLGIVIGPYVEMKNLVTQYNIGVVSESNHVIDMAKLISGLSREQTSVFKKNSDKAAKELCGEKEIQKMADVFKNLM